MCELCSLSVCFVCLIKNLQMENENAHIYHTSAWSFYEVRTLMEDYAYGLIFAAYSPAQTLSSIYSWLHSLHIQNSVANFTEQDFFMQKVLQKKKLCFADKLLKGNKWLMWPALLLLMHVFTWKCLEIMKEYFLLIRRNELR